MKKTTYVVSEASGRKGAEKVAEAYAPGGAYYRPGNQVTIEHGEVPCWGSGIPGSSSFGKTEPGYRVVVTNKK